MKYMHRLPARWPVATYVHTLLANVFWAWFNHDLATHP